MPTYSTKESILGAAQGIGSLLESIGTTIKESKRKGAVQKVMEGFNDPNKLFLDEQGKPRSPAEVLPKISEGVFSLYQLDEPNLANQLLGYYDMMGKQFGQEATNVFNYELIKSDKRFPKDQQGQPQAYDPRVSYPQGPLNKEFAPKPPLSNKPLVIHGAEGKVKVMTADYDPTSNSYVWKVTEEWEETKPVSRAFLTQYNKSDFAAGIIDITDNAGNVIGQTEWDPDKGILYKGKYISIEQFNNITGNRVSRPGTTDDEGQGAVFTPKEQWKGIQDETNKILDHLYKGGQISAQDMQGVWDYIEGRRTTYPVAIWDLFQSAEGLEWMQSARQFYLERVKK